MGELVLPAAEDLEALEFWIQGYNYREIAELQGIDWHTTARARVLRALEKAPKFKAHEYRLLKSMEYDQRRSELRSAAGQLKQDLRIEGNSSAQVNTRARTARSLAELEKQLTLLDEREAKLWGADMPQQVEVAAKVDHTVTVEQMFLDALDLTSPMHPVGSEVEGEIVDAVIVEDGDDEPPVGDVAGMVDEDETGADLATETADRGNVASGLIIVERHHRGRNRNDSD